ncbi:hypothetical protein F8M41_024513 [Gigaspora margarita]|uniref:Uncharacterized protein n=1 Tax=Gigaspora margarita TaxID=4874 RepID=A0A8H3XKU9_GIGMA|nr:hypothetical protein F8M41_024513 [Gigaspora margarita]
MTSGNASIPLPEGTGVQAQDALQALLTMAANLNSFGTQHNVQSGSEIQGNTTYNQPAYINIPVEDVPLFVVGSRDDAQSYNTMHRTKRHRAENGDLESGEEESLEQLLQKEKEPSEEKEVKVVENSSKTIPLNLSELP